MKMTKEKDKHLKLDSSIIGESTDISMANTVKTIINGKEITVNIPKTQ
jgi:hypothetical protein